MYKRKKLMILFFLIPPLVPLSIFVIYPVVATFYLSFVNDQGQPTLSNYVSVLTQTAPEFALVMLNNMPRPPPWGALIHNMVWLAIHLPLVTFLGLILAYMLRVVYGRSIIKSIMFIGMVVPMVVGGLIIRFMFEKYVGVVPVVLGALGLKALAKSWTIYPDTALFALILGSVWLWTGFSLTVHAAAIDSIPSSYIEAAKIDGASEWQIFKDVVVPLVRPATLTVIVMTTLWDLKIFDIVYAATMGGPGGASTVLAFIMWLYFARQLAYHKAAAVAVILTLLTMVPVTILIRMVRRRGG